LWAFGASSWGGFLGPFSVFRADLLALLAFRAADLLDLRAADLLDLRAADFMLFEAALPAFDALLAATFAPFPMSLANNLPITMIAFPIIFSGTKTKLTIGIIFQQYFFFLTASKNMIDWQEHDGKLSDLYNAYGTQWKTIQKHMPFASVSAIRKRMKRITQNKAPWKHTCSMCGQIRRGHSQGKCERMQRENAVNGKTESNAPPVRLSSFSEIDVMADCVSLFDAHIYAFEEDLYGMLAARYASITALQTKTDALHSEVQEMMRLHLANVTS
jgi:hypothetical protein